MKKLLVVADGSGGTEFWKGGSDGNGDQHDRDRDITAKRCLCLGRFFLWWSMFSILFKGAGSQVKYKRRSKRSLEKVKSKYVVLQSCFI